MNYTFGNIQTGAKVKTSGLAIAAWGVINGPVTPPTSGTDENIPLLPPVIVANTRAQYAAVNRLGTVEGATSYNMRWSWDQINWTVVNNVQAIHELTFPASLTARRTIYAQHQAVVGGVPQAWTNSGIASVAKASFIRMVVPPQSKNWQIGDRLADYVSPEGLTIAQMLDPSNFIVDAGYTITSIVLSDHKGFIGDLKSLTQRVDSFDIAHYMIKVYYTTPSGDTGFMEFEPMARYVSPDVWLDVRVAQGTDILNIPVGVSNAMVLPDFKHTINGTTYTTSGVTVGQLRAGPVPVTGAAGVTIANIAPAQWATLGVTAGQELKTVMGRQHVWVPVYGSNPGPRVKINVYRGAQQVAGEGVAFDVDIWDFDSRRDWRKVWHDPLHDLAFKWTVPGRTRTTPVNMRTPWRDGTVAYGPFPKCVIRNPGDWTASVIVSERSSGKYATYTTPTQTTADPATVFAGAATIIVTGGGSQTGAPAGATVVVDWTAAVAALKANRETKKRILFSSHVEHTMNTQISLGGGCPNIYIGSYGPGRARLNTTVANKYVFYVFPIGLDQNGAIIRDVSFKGPWDPTTETGQVGSVAIMFEKGGWITILDCDAENFETSYGTRDHGDNYPGGFILSECSSKGHRDYALYCATSQLSRDGIIGNLLMQNPNAMQGGLAKGTTNPANKHFVRVMGSQDVYIDGNDFFARGGWTPPIGGMPVDQGIRDHSNHPRSYSYVCRNVIEGANGMISGGAASPSQETADGFHFARNRVVENNLLIASARTATIFGGQPGSTIRGNLAIKPRVKSSPFDATKQNFGRVVEVGTDVPSVYGDWHISGLTVPSHIHHNTLIHLGDAVTDPGELPYMVHKKSGPQVLITESDNIIYAPNHPTWDAKQAAPMVATDEGLDPRMLGYKWRYELLPQYPAQPVMRTEFASPIDTIRLWRPGAGSPAAVGTGELKPLFDFDGNLAPGMPNGVGTTVPGTIWSGALKAAA